MRWHRPALILAIGALSAGCYSYAPVAPSSAPVGVAVRARLTEPEAERIRGLLGRDDRLIEGTLMESVPDAIVIAVPTTPGTSTPALGGARLHQRISVQVPGLVELEARSLDRLRTGLFVGAVVAVAGYVIGSQFVSADSPEGNDKPGDDRLVVPVFSFFLDRR